MSSYLKEKYLKSSSCVLYCNATFDVLQLNDTAKSYFPKPSSVSGKANLVSDFNFNVVNIPKDSLLDILSSVKKWNGTISFTKDNKTVQYFSATIHLEIVKSRKYIIIQFKLGNTNKQSSEIDLLFNNHFKKILNASNEGYVLMNKDYVIVSINKRAQLMTKITHGRPMLLGHSMFEYLPVEAHQYCIGITEKVLSGEKVSLTAEYPGLNGKKTLLSTDYLPAFDDDGKIMGVIVHSIDISEQHYSRLKIEAAAFEMQSVLSSTTEGIAMISLDYKVLLFNPKMDFFVKFVFGIQIGGKIGGNFFDYILPERRELVKQVFDKVVNGEKIELEQKIHNKWLLASYTSIKDKNEKVIAVCISIREITEIINKKLEIEQRELLYNTTLNNIAEAVVLLDNKLKTLHINKEAEVLFRLLNIAISSAAKFSLSANGFKVVNSAESNLLNLNNWKKINGQEKDVLLFRIHDNSKKTFLANITVVKGINPEGEYIQYVLSIRDISKIEKMSEAINHLSLIAKNISIGVILSDANGFVQWVNKAFTSITAYKFDDIIGKTVSSLLEGPETDSVVTKKIKNIKVTKLPFTCEALNYKKSGEKFWVELAVQPILDKAGKLLQVYILQTDITNRKLLEKQLEEERRENQHNITRAIYKAYEEERSFLSKELHDSVNQKITASIFNLTRYKNSATDKSELLQSSLELMKGSMSEIRRLSKKLIAKELLHFSFEEAINQMIHSTIMAFPDLQCEIIISPKCDKLLSDELKVNIFRIIQEQLQNVIKHSKATKVSVNAEIMNDNRLELITSDNGKGFSLTTKKDGIGLINIFNRVDSFNGEHNVVSSPGNGCQFIISFPI